MKKQEKDNLRGLFQDMELSNLPQGFEDRLMLQIHQTEAVSKAKQAFKNKIYNGILITLGVAGMLGLPLLIFYFTTGNIGFEFPAMSFDYSIPRFPKMDIDPIAVMLPFVVLILLMGDTLIRKHISDKKHHKT